MKELNYNVPSKFLEVSGWSTSIQEGRWTEKNQNLKLFKKINELVKRVYVNFLSSFVKES